MAALVGCGAHGADIAKIWHRCYGHEMERYDDKTATPIDQLAHGNYYIGVNDPIARWNLSVRLPACTSIPLIDPESTTWDARLDAGVIIAPNVTMLYDCRIGLHTHVNYGATMTRTHIADFTTISPGVTICGDVRVGSRVLIGAGAVVCDRVTIGNDVTIGAGALILPGTQIPSYTKWVGSPVRQVK